MQRLHQKVEVLDLRWHCDYALTDNFAVEGRGWRSLFSHLLHIRANTLFSVCDDVDLLDALPATIELLDVNAIFDI